ncbi:MAG: type II secretion system F family protein [Deltaproteobacteria bacterium]
MNEATLRLGSIGLVVLGIFMAVYFAMSATDSSVHRAWHRHVDALDKQVRLLYLKTSGLDVARKQRFVVLVLLVAAAFLRDANGFALFGLALAAAIVPKYYLDGEITKRKTKIDAQLDTFLTTLSNALKSSPSLGDALATSANLMRSPIKEDLEFALKENKLGTPLDQALVNMSRRIDSRTFNSALTTLLIGRQTGGDLPKILEQSASTLRELARLEGVVRTKTAEGKSQAYVLGAIPFVVTVALNMVDPEWLTPLTTSFTGYVVMLIATSLWLTAVFASRRILNVDV